MPTSLVVCTLLALGAAEPLHIDDFELHDSRGVAWKLGASGNHRLMVVAFVGNDCPLARLYGPRLAQLSREFSPRGVGFVAINSNQQDSLTGLAQYAKLHQIDFPVLKDPGNVVADRFGAERTPEVFVLDSDHIVRYRGRIDDQYSVGLQRPQVGRRDLAEALEELLAGKPVSQPVVGAAGCRIGRVSKADSASQVTYCKDIATFLQKHCQLCHRQGEIAPFPLTTYKEVVGWAETIQDVLADQRMPPWHADPKYGKFANDPRPSAEAKQRVYDWVRAGAPEGDPKDLPPPAQFAEGWNISKPDLVVRMKEPFTVPAEGVIEYQTFEVDPGFTEDVWVQAAEVRPGNRAVVHHSNVFLKPPGATGPVEFGSLGSYCLAGTTPGTPPLVLPPGMAKRVPRGWTLVFVTHYVAIGSEQTDQTSIGLVFVNPREVKQDVATHVLYDLDLNIPPNVTDHRVEHTWKAPDDVVLLSLFPHMHLRGKAFRYEAVYPDGRVQILLDVPHYDFNWQNRYVLAEPLRLPAGSLVRCVALYDNSAGNLSNPNPNITVHTGPQTWDEMFNGYFEVALADQDLTKAKIDWSLWSLVGAGGALVLLLVNLLRQRFRSARVPAATTTPGG